jgi:hypothetical protein
MLRAGFEATISVSERVKRLLYDDRLYSLLAVPGHALLWLIPVTWKSKKREEAHVSNMFNFPMPVCIQYFLWFHLLCRYIDCVVCRPWNTQHIIVHVRSNQLVHQANHDSYNWFEYWEILFQPILLLTSHTCRNSP